MSCMIMVATMKPVMPLLLLLLNQITLMITSFGNENPRLLCHESERQALLSFKQDLKDPSNRLSSWIVEEDCCKWAGIVCHNVTGHVEELHLANTLYDAFRYAEEDNGETAREAFQTSILTGKINLGLLNLKHLTHIDLSYNDFGGIQIPTFLGSMRSLRYLNLSGAGFGGRIPHQLGNLSSLHSLGLGCYVIYSLSYYTLFSDNMKWLQGLSSLENLDMSNVDLHKASDHWLQVLNNLPSLLELQMADCWLNRIPSLPFVNFTSLNVLHFPDNNFESLIPQWIFSLRSLISLDLSYNGLVGPIPFGIQNLTSLRDLGISDNHLNGSLPNSLFALRGLVSLSLSWNALRGPIPFDFVNMSSLMHLDLSGNDFNSTIPNCFYSFRSLETLDLSLNNLQGELSSNIENLTSLLHLGLSSNQFRGHIPRSMGNLCQLREIDLRYNNFEGVISKVFESFSGCLSSGLEVLFLGNNHLSTTMPMRFHFEQFQNLRWLDLRSNLISGSIPESITKISSLISLDISYNEFNGTLPQNIGGLSNLRHLFVDGNHLEGVVSEAHFANLTKLRYLQASGNSLILNVNPHWIPPFQLLMLNLHSWKLGFQFPMWIQSQKHMGYLDLSSTQISDASPSWIWNFSSNLYHLNLSHNQIHGQIPKLHSLRTGGSIVYPSPHLWSNIDELDLSNNLFFGQISHFLCHSKINEPHSLMILNLRKNHLFGKIPNCWKNWPSLLFIDLGSNNFTGKIPNSIGNLFLLKSLHLRNNSLFGELPRSLRKCTSLEDLDIGMNKIIGSIPIWIGTSLLHLKYLFLRSNQFTGQIPEELCQLSFLQIMDVAENHLLGNFPKCFNNFSAMTKQHYSYERISYPATAYEFVENGRIKGTEFMENAQVVIKRFELEYNTILPLVTSLDLSSNNISGEIPEELTSLWGLVSLNLSNNNLKGTIPHKIGDMKFLESLDLSINHLFGQIPPSMSSLSFLSHLNLSYNMLSGKIPLGTQLQSFNDSCFIGNKLCGPPLTKNCSSKEITPTTDHRHTEEKEVGWLFLFVALGFAVGFGGVWLPLYCSKAWRCTYFAFIDSMLIKIWVFF